IGLGSIASTGVARGYMSIDALTHLTGTGSANDIEVKVRNTAQEGQTMHTVEDVLMANHVTVINAAPHYNNISSNTSATGLVNVLRVLVAMAVALASLVIINTVITLVAEQTQIIGTMKALGGTRSTILRSYLLTVSI